MYNNSATIGRALSSILDQDGVDFEIVVVDDDSSDDCAAIAAAMLRPQDRLVRNSPRLGLNGNHNKCLEVARGDLIQFVHGDDWLLPGALKTLAACFDDPAVGVAFAPRQIETDDADWARRYGRIHTHFRKLGEYNRGSSLVTQMVARGAKDNWIGEPTCVMFRRRLALDAGGFRADIFQLVDIDFWMRLMLRSAVRFVPQELSVRNHTTATATTRVMATRRNLLDRQHVLTWMIMDPMSPNRIRIAAALWWIPAWVALLIEVAILGPQRRQHVKTLAMAPFREFRLAREVRDSMIRPVQPSISAVSPNSANVSDTSSRNASGEFRPSGR